MSTLNTAELFLSWKEEVNRRLADHRNRKQASEIESLPEAHPEPAGRGARAVARVAERFAGAPSYSQMLAEEARAAMRAAQAAQKAAEQAQAAAQMVLAGLEAASSPELSGDSGAADPEPPAFAAVAEGTEADPFDAMRLEPTPQVAPPRDSAGARKFDFAVGAQPLSANLIQFPRELVATRRVRPRRVEGPFASLESAKQLSIFEVEPAAVSTQPAEAIAIDPAAPEWMCPEWPAAESDPRAQEEPITPPAARAAVSQIVDLAPVGRRLLAIVVDNSLSLALSLGVLDLSAKTGILPRSPRAFDLVAVLVLLLVCAAYQALFSVFTSTTPGKWYAGLGLGTLDGCVAARTQRLRRLLALPLSVLPLGLGLAWSLFDEDGLTWHDRLSGTFPRLR